jgi:hypothetical protein
VSADDDAQSGECKAAWWTLPLLALGLGIVACAILIPAAEENRLAEAERRRLTAEVEALAQRASLNEDFLARIHRDKHIAKRLARQAAPPKPDSRLVVLAAGLDASTISNPLAMLEPQPVELLPPPPPADGLLPRWCLDSRGRLGVAGAGLFACLVALLAGDRRVPRGVPT